MNVNFKPILLASDINVYSMARAFYEEYKVKSLVLTKKVAGPIDNSKILDYEIVEDLDNPKIFLSKMEEIYNRYKKNNIKLILIGCYDNYVRLIIDNKKLLDKKFVTPYTTKEVLNNICLKENFYSLCDKYNLPYPKTLIYNRKMGNSYKLNFNFPVVLKPSDSVEYWKASFEDQHKVYFVQTKEELDYLLEKIYNSGYKGNMIIQDMIPGSDSQMYDLHVYVGKDKKVKYMNLGNVLLEEHTPKGIGCNAVTITTFNKDIMLKVKEVLEGIGYSGWADCDLKYDKRDNEFKIFEINIRQGRSHYRLTGSGNNVSKYIVEDFIYNKDINFKLEKEEFLWYVIPKRIIYKYIKDKNIIKKINNLIKTKKSCNSLYYKEDLNFKRRVYLFLRDINQFRKYKKYYKIYKS